MKKKFIIVMLCSITASFIATLGATEKKAERQTKTSSPVEKYHCKRISRAEAISQARARVKGKVVGVQLSGSVYRVRMLVAKKRIKSVSINACR